MNAIVEQALALWGIEAVQTHLIAARENHVYRVVDQGTALALRIHRCDYRTDEELLAELSWMDALSQRGILVPAPLKSKSDTLFAVIDGAQVVILCWLDGDFFDPALHPLDVSKAHFFQLGEALAKLHHACDDWQPAAEFDRPHWDANGLVGASPVWGPFWENPALSDPQRTQLLSLRTHAMDLFERSELDYGLIHADPVRENILVKDNTIRFIDFDDGGFGFRLFDIATALVKIIDITGFEDFKSALLDGYKTHRAINVEQLDLFLALRAATYVGWNITRMDEDGSNDRNRRYIDDAFRLANAI